MGKVKEVISENETLHEKQKLNHISGVDHRSGDGTDSDEASTTGMDSDAKVNSLFFTHLIFNHYYSYALFYSIHHLRLKKTLQNNSNRWTDQIFYTNQRSPN